MKCVECGSGDLYCDVTLTRRVLLAARGGSVKVGGVKVSQLDLKDSWEQENGVERQIRGPIFCLVCLTEHVYVVGRKEPLLRGNYQECLELGPEMLRS